MCRNDSYAKVPKKSLCYYTRNEVIAWCVAKLTCNCRSQLQLEAGAADEQPALCHSDVRPGGGSDKKHSQGAAALSFIKFSALSCASSSSTSSSSSSGRQTTWWSFIMRRWRVAGDGWLRHVMHPGN